MAQQPEFSGHRKAIGLPKIVSDQIHGLPANRHKMGKQCVWHSLATAACGIERTAEIEAMNGASADHLLAESKA